MIIDPKHAYLFKAPGAKRWINRDRGPKPNALLPKTYQDSVTRGFSPDRFAYSTDSAMLSLTERLSTRLNDEFPVDTNPDGFAGPSAVASDFNGLRNVSGMGSDPLPIPLMDNTNFVASLGLNENIDEQDKPWMREIIKLFFGHVTPAPLRIRKSASTSFPYFTSNNQYKKMATLKCLDNIDDYLKALSGDTPELKRALDEYHSLLVYAIHERQQPNSISQGDNGVWKSKDRKAPTEAESRTGIADGGAPADFSVRNEQGQIISDHFAMRRRTVFGFSGIPNYVMTAVMGCVREVYTNRFAFTYKTKGWEDKEDRISKYDYIVGSDVKNMDTTVPPWFFDFFTEELRNYWADPLVDVLKRMFAATFVCPEPWIDTPDEYNPVFGPDPLSGEATVKPGLASGIFINPDIGKLWMTFVYVILFRDSGALKSPADIEAFLSGRNRDHALLDMSDDACMMTNSPRVREMLIKAQSKYALLEPEIPVIYLGDVFTMEGGRKHAYPNPVTFVVNALAREDSIDRKDPITYSEGVLARQEQYARTPIFSELNRIYEEEVRRAIGVNPYLIARSVAKRQRFNEIDALVIANPHYLHYRVDPKDVSESVLDELVATIPAEDFFNKIRHLFKVPTVELTEMTKS